MATIVHKTINGHGPYAYRVTYVGNGKQNWEYLGKVGGGVPSDGPVTNDGGETEPEADIEDFDLTEISELPDFLEAALGEDAERYADTTATGVPDFNSTGKLEVRDDGTYDVDDHNELIGEISITHEIGDGTITVKNERKGYHGETLFEETFDIDEADNQDIAEAVRAAHEKNAEVVAEEVESIESEHGNLDGVENLVWKHGAKEQIEKQSAEEVTERYGTNEKTAAAVTGFETEVERREAQNDPAPEVEEFLDEIPNLPSNAKESLGDEFVVVEQLENASAGELEDVDGVGPTTSERLQWFADYHGTDYEKTISDSESVDRVETLESEVIDRGLISEVNDKTGMSRYGLFRHDDYAVSMNVDDLEKGGFKQEYGTGVESYEQVLAHEFAHSLEDSHVTDGDQMGEAYDANRFNDFSEEAQREIEYFQRFAQDDDRRKPHERFTNYISSLVVEPERTRKMTPTFTEQFEEDVLENTSGDRREVLEKIIEGDL